MKEQLELKHILPYLPYNLKAEILDYKRNYVGYQFDMLLGVEQWSKCGKLWSFQTKEGSRPSLKEIKPLLRPLSDVYTGDWMERLQNEEKKDPNKNLDSTLIFICIDCCEYWVIEFLIKNKFDVFGLIDKGLAHECKNM